MNNALHNEIPRKVNSYFIAVAIGLIVLFFDIVTKYLTSVYLPPFSFYNHYYPYGGIGVFQNFLGVQFSLNHMINTGAAWGLLGDYQIPLLIARIGLILGLLFYFFKCDYQTIFQIPLALILSGAIGNVIDYFIYGHVIDMFHFVLWGYDFPVFNVADSAISIGIGLMILFSYMTE